MSMTLGELRSYIDALERVDGDYYVVCGRTGDRPVPVAGRRFAERATARSAARAASQYRATLRRYDPRARDYDFVVCEDTTPDAETPADDAGLASTGVVVDSEG